MKRFEVATAEGRPEKNRDFCSIRASLNVIFMKAEHIVRIISVTSC
jgi:hypothetical protein